MTIQPSFTPPRLGDVFQATSRSKVPRPPDSENRSLSARIGRSRKFHESDASAMLAASLREISATSVPAPCHSNPHNYLISEKDLMVKVDPVTDRCPDRRESVLRRPAEPRAAGVTHDQAGMAKKSRFVIKYKRLSDVAGGTSSGQRHRERIRDGQARRARRAARTPLVITEPNRRRAGESVERFGHGRRLCTRARPPSARPSQ